jgi:hypothetical protein
MIMTAYRPGSSSQLPGSIQSQGAITPKGELMTIEGPTSKNKEWWIIRFKADVMAGIRSWLMFINKALSRYLS